MSTNQRTDAFKGTLKKIKTAEQLDEAMSSMDASSKYRPLLLQSLTQIGKGNLVEEYQRNFLETEED